MILMIIENIEKVVYSCTRMFFLMLNKVCMQPLTLLYFHIPIYQPYFFDVPYKEPVSMQALACS